MNRKIVTVDIEDTPGTLGTAAQCLAKENLNIEGFSVESGHARFLVTHADRAQACLEEGGFSPRIQTAFEVELPNKPGQLANLGTQLGKVGVNIEACFGIASGGSGRLVVCVDNPAKAQPIIDRLAGTVTSPARP